MSPSIKVVADNNFGSSIYVEDAS
ncbi:hypothetical protein CCACVL1_17548 [Corchorus capsularis]|uniref:Uncharacterized protein n=1 Tax=Corchorus capsularis TaxID=210143 RepID=A0A1R3HRD3_COCAP|nr:hypothetical protein CCACVL1_17548 [Corchorus capsularis]